MNSLLANGVFPLIVVIAFVAIVLFVESAYLIWNTYKGADARQAERRIRALSAASDRSERTAVLKNRLLSEVPVVERLLLNVPRMHLVDRWLVQSGLDWTVSRLLLLTVGLGFAAHVAMSFLDALPAVDWTISLLSGASPAIFVMARRRNRLTKVVQQLPDALDFIARALRAGNALPQALQMVSVNMVDPIAFEFRITHDEVNFGVSIQQAMENLATRVPVADMGYFAVAVLVQRDAGGNLSEVLENLSRLIRDRLKFYGKVRVLSTEGRWSAWVLCLLPFALGGLLEFVNHEFISVLWTDPIGIQLTYKVLAMMAIGAFWSYRIVQIRV
jgi:tight adherence protein B